MSLRCSTAGYRQYLHSVSRPLKLPYITNCLGAIIHTKPDNSNFSPKIGSHGNDPKILGLRYIFIRQLDLENPPLRIKHRLASYHTTKVIANKASYSKLRPKIGCHGNLLQHLWTPIQHMIPTAHSMIQADNPNGISIGLAVFAQMTAESPYIVYNGTPLPPFKIAPSHGGSEPPSNAWFLGLTRVLNGQPKRHLDRCSRFCRAH